MSIPCTRSKSGVRFVEPMRNKKKKYKNNSNAQLTRKFMPSLKEKAIKMHFKIFLILYIYIFLQVLDRFRELSVHDCLLRHFSHAVCKEGDTILFPQDVDIPIMTHSPSTMFPKKCSSLFKQFFQK